MGRTQASHGLPPPEFRKSERAKQAKVTVNKTIPALLASNARARLGVEAVELIANPSPNKNISEKTHENVASDAQIRLQVADTLDVARELLQQSPTATSQKKCKVAILNMASSLRPGGGFLEGATSQEESICMRSTLYASLREEFYRLPEVGGVYSPDVLVFRDGNNTDLPKQDRFFCDVVTAGMLKYPELVDVDEDVTTDVAVGYANSKDRELMLEKMRGVLRIMRQKGASKIVLGAWGCGAYGNPVHEVAQGWAKVLLGKGGKKKGLVETWEGLEIVFAIRERKMAEEFAKYFGHGLEVEVSVRNHGSREEIVDLDAAMREELLLKIREREEQLTQARNPILREALEKGLRELKSQLAESGYEDDSAQDISEAGHEGRGHNSPAEDS